MPVYEYRCSSCGRKFAKLVGMVAGASTDRPVCPACGAEDVTRLISRFSNLKDEDARLDSLEQAALAGADDPGSMSKLLREMGKEMGDEGEDGMDEYLEESQRELYDATSADGDAEFA